jgi:hypothetical protein
LPSVLGKQFLQDYLGALNLCGIELAFHGEADLTLFEAVEDVRLGDGLVPLVFDPPDDRTLCYIVDKNFSVWIVRVIFDLKTNIFEELRIPERLEITVDSFLGKWITSAGKNAGEKRIALNAPVTLEINAIDRELRARGRLRSLSPDGMHD